MPGAAAWPDAAPSGDDAAAVMWLDVDADYLAQLELKRLKA